MISTIVLAYPPHLEVRMDLISQNKPFSLGQYFEGFVTVCRQWDSHWCAKEEFHHPKIAFLSLLLFASYSGSYELGLFWNSICHVTQAGLTRDPPTSASQALWSQRCAHRAWTQGPFHCPIGLPLTGLWQTHNRQLCRMAPSVTFPSLSFRGSKALLTWPADHGEVQLAEPGIYWRHLSSQFGHSRVRLPWAAVCRFHVDISWGTSCVLCTCIPPHLPISPSPTLPSHESPAFPTAHP